MRTFILALAFVFSTSAFACEVQSAQFLGSVKNYTQIPTGEASNSCTYQIEFSRFSTSTDCPLALSDVATAEFQDYSCALHNGQTVAGTVTKKGNTFYVYLN